MKIEFECIWFKFRYSFVQQRPIFSSCVRVVRLKKNSLLIIKQLTNLNHDFGFAELTKELMRGDMRASFCLLQLFSKQQIVLEIIFIILSFSPLAEERKNK